MFLLFHPEKNQTKPLRKEINKTPSLVRPGNKPQNEQKSCQKQKRLKQKTCSKQTEILMLQTSERIKSLEGNGHKPRQEALIYINGRGCSAHSWNSPGCGLVLRSRRDSTKKESYKLHSHWQRRTHLNGYERQGPLYNANLKHCLSCLGHNKR